jgi:hypothetical protein
MISNHLVARARRWLSPLLVALLLGASMVTVTAESASASSPTLSCTSSPNLLNTGYNSGTGTVLADGSTDANWQVAGPFGSNIPAANTPASATDWPVQPAPVGATFAPAFVSNEASGAWVSGLSGTQWIHQGASGNQAGPGASWYYRYSLNIDPSVNASDLTVALSFYADNAVGEVWVNSTAQSLTNSSLPQDPSDPYYYHGYASGSEAHVNLATGWVTGANTITVQTFSAPGFEGFDVHADVSSLCTVTAVNDTASVSTGGSTVLDVTANDEHAAPLNPASVQVLSTGAAHGTTSVNTTTGAVTYTPTAGFSGADSFQYNVCDTQSAPVCSTATVSVVVNNVFTSGVAASGVSTGQNTPVTTPLSSVVSTSGAALNPTAVTQVTAPAHGSLSISPTTGAVTYTPNSNYTGPDSYQVHACDTSSPVQCHTVTVPVTVGANTVTANPDTATTQQGSPVTTHVLANDTVSSGGAALNPASVQVVTSAAHGTTSVNPTTGAVTYTPTGSFSGTDSYQYTVCDLSSPTPICSAATTVSVVVNNVFTSGVAGSSVVSNPQNTPIDVPLSAIATVSGAPLNPAATTIDPTYGPFHGSVTIGSTGTLTYTPDNGYSGPDSFVVQVCDTSTPVQCSSIPVTVAVGVGVVNAAPDTATTSPAHALTIDVLGNDTSSQPLDPASLTVMSLSGSPGINGTGIAQHGTVTVNHVTGTVSYVPDGTFTGVDAFQYSICDSSFPTPVCATTTVSVTVVAKAVLAETGVNDVGPLGSVGAVASLIGILLLLVARRRFRQASHR